MSGAAFPLAPGSVIGILGGGQLGRMLAMAAARLGFDVAVLDPEPDAPAKRLAAHRLTGAYDDSFELTKLAAIVDVITFEFENVPAQAIAILETVGAAVAPCARALAIAQGSAGGEKPSSTQSPARRRSPSPR